MNAQKYECNQQFEDKFKLDYAGSHSNRVNHVRHQANKNQITCFCFDDEQAPTYF